MKCCFGALATGSGVQTRRFGGRGPHGTGSESDLPGGRAGMVGVGVPSGLPYPSTAPPRPRTVLLRAGGGEEGKVGRVWGDGGEGCRKKGRRQMGIEEAGGVGEGSEPVGWGRKAFRYPLSSPCPTFSGTLFVSVSRTARYFPGEPHAMAACMSSQCDCVLAFIHFDKEDPLSFHLVSLVFIRLSVCLQF